jgi:pyruvate dehydrogenase kinase 2/3/4
VAVRTSVDDLLSAANLAWIELTRQIALARKSLQTMIAFRRLSRDAARPLRRALCTTTSSEQLDATSGMVFGGREDAQRRRESAASKWPLLLKKKVTPVRLQDLLTVAARPTPQQHMLNAQWLAGELPVRFAHELASLEDLPRALSENAHVLSAMATYDEVLHQVLEHPKPGASEEAESAFELMLTEAHRSLYTVPPKLGAALTESHADPNAFTEAEQREIDLALDRFFSARIGMRVLVQNYLATKRPRDGFAGIIMEHCSPVDVCSAAAASKAMIEACDGAAPPEITVLGDAAATFAFVPSHIFFVVAELLKNSVRAVAARHGASSEGMPAIKVIVACSDDSFTIKVADEGGGIRRSELADVWSYKGNRLAVLPAAAPDAPAVSSCAASEVEIPAQFRTETLSDLVTITDEAVHSPVGRRASITPILGRPSHGLGLPLARCYAKYFGGTLHMIPVEGYGVDCYVRFNRLSGDNREIAADALGQDADVLSRSLLFDAQSRRRTSENYYYQDGAGKGRYHGRKNPDEI